ncbi:MAG: hypothetical protein Q8T13_16420 [Acidobacteriota bacterium]|nr:hypothetical protein [Acidobacteriota bacterium]
MKAAVSKSREQQKRDQQMAQHLEEVLDAIQSKAVKVLGRVLNTEVNPRRLIAVMTQIHDLADPVAKARAGNAVMTLTSSRLLKSKLQTATYSHADIVDIILTALRLGAEENDQVLYVLDQYAAQAKRAKTARDTRIDNGYRAKQALVSRYDRLRRSHPERSRRWYASQLLEPSMRLDPKCIDAMSKKLSRLPRK